MSSLPPLSQLDLEDPPDYPLPTPRPVSLPSETILHILGYFDVESKVDGSSDRKARQSFWAKRSSDLARVARVNWQWKEMAYSQLYGHLRIDWCYTTSPILIRSFRQNPALYDLVVELEVVRLVVPASLLDTIATAARVQASLAKSLDALDADELVANLPTREELSGPAELLKILEERLQAQEASMMEAIEKAKREALGDVYWLTTDEGVKEGSDALWEWIAGLAGKNLIVLMLARFTHAPPVDPRIDSVLANLRQLTLCGPGLPHASILSKIPAVERLTLSRCYRDKTQVGAAPPLMNVDDLSTTGNLNSLRTFASTFSSDLDRHVLAQKPRNLEYLELRGSRPTDIDRFLTPTLPLLTELKALSLRLEPIFEFSPEFLFALSFTSIVQLYSNAQPAECIADHLPPTLRTLHLITSDSDPTNPYDFTPLLNAPLWRKNRSSAPHLQGVTFTLPNINARTDAEATRKRIQEIKKKAAESGIYFMCRERRTV
ncbi:hypothetical protein RQP46_003503 [Phenoliferia psychrophenolica]